MKLRWKEFILALAMAVTLWYGMSGTEIVESQIDVRVDYKGVPQDLIIRGNGMVNKVSVRVRGPGGQVRVMSTRDYVFAMDLSTLKKGQNTLPIPASQLGLFGGLQVIDVTPPSIQLDVDTLEVKEVHLKADIQGTLPGGYAAEATFTPAMVSVRGPSMELDDLKEILISLQLGEITGPDTRELQAPVLPLPPGVEATPPQALAHVRVDVKRKTVNVTRTVQAEAPAAVGVYVRPARVKISVAMPETIVTGAGDNKEIRAFVTLPERQLGTYILPVRVSLPEGAQIVDIEPSEVSVTLEQKN